MIGGLTIMWVGTVALAVTLAGIAVSVSSYQDNESSLTGLIMYGFGLLFWILFALHSTSYVRVLGDGSVETVTTPSFTVVGVLGVVLSVLLLLDGGMRAIRSA